MNGKGKLRRCFAAGAAVVLACMLMFTPLREMKYTLGIDKFAHAGCAYAVCDALSRFTGAGAFRRCIVLFALGTANEVTDKEWSNADLVFTMLGGALQAGVELLARKEESV